MAPTVTSQHSSQTDPFKESSDATPLLKALQGLPVILRLKVSFCSGYKALSYLDLFTPLFFFHLVPLPTPVHSLQFFKHPSHTHHRAIALAVSPGAVLPCPPYGSRPLSSRCLRKRHLASDVTPDYPAGKGPMCPMPTLVLPVTSPFLVQLSPCDPTCISSYIVCFLFPST